MNTTKAEYLPIGKLRSFENHPFQVKDDDEMEQLVWSILSQGVMTPILVRPIGNDEYEVISGHRRVHACRKVGIDTVPALIYALDRDTAAIALVDSNLHRERILPSEKAFAYKLKLEAMSRQGQRTDLTSSQLATKLDTAAEIGKAQGESRDKVYRYIRLTNLIPDILQKVDEGKIAFTPAVELSYLSETEQEILLDAMGREDCTPSLSQAVQMKKLSQTASLDQDRIFEIMSQPKANQREMFKVPMERLRRFFPGGNAQQAEDFVLKACEHYHKYLLRLKAQSR